jgi:hypothetical protein
MDRFDLAISSPQVSGIPFSGTATTTAFDIYGNVKTNYDASVDTVVISSSAGGIMSNNILRLQTDFTDGVADLAAIGVTYDGRGGNMTFTALSQSGAAGISNELNMRAIFCSGLIIDQGILSWEDTATGTIGVTNDGGVPVALTDLVVLTESGISLNPSSTVPTLPDSIPSGVNRIFDIRVPIFSGMDQGIHPLKAVATGAFGPSIDVDTLASFADTIEVQPASQIGYIDGSLSRDTISIGEVYSLSIRLGNTGGAGLGLIDSSYLFFTDGTLEYKSPLLNGVYLPPDSPLGTVVVLDSTQVPFGFVENDYAARFYYFGQENGHFVSDSVDITNLITVQSGSDLNYIAGSLNIDTLVNGQTATFSIGISNSGAAGFILDHFNTTLRFSDSQRDFITYSDTSASVRVDIIESGDTTLYFASNTLADQFAPGVYIPTVTIRGVQNGIDQTIVFNTSPDSVHVISRSSLRIDSTFVMSRNAPFVNVSQQCSIRVVIRNTADEGVDSVYLRMTSDGSSGYADSVYLGYVAGHGFASLNYNVTSAVVPDSGEIFVSSIIGGVGEVSGMSPRILSPLDNAALLIIETPAELALSPIWTAWPPGAEDDTVTVGQDITIGIFVDNLGEAGISGSQQLVLDTGSSGFVIADSATRDFEINQDIFWDLTAPPDPVTSAILTIRFVTFPLDINDGSSAVGADSVSTKEFTVDTRPSISHTPVIDLPSGARDGVVSTGQTFVVTDTISAFGDYHNLSVYISLPSGFTTNDSLIKHPTGNLAQWNIRAPDMNSLDTISVISWLYDNNNGDSISTGVYSMEVETVGRAVLNLGTAIIGPEAALDGIVEPGGYLEYEALVNNEGQAGAGMGRLSLHIGHPDMVTSDPLDRDFAPGSPVSWTITAPFEEIPYAVPIWVTLDSIPDDENTNSSAAVISDSSSINVSVRELLPRMEFSVAQEHSGSVVKGQHLGYLSFLLRNNDRGGSFPIAVTRVKLTAGSRYSAESFRAGDVIAAASLFADSINVSDGVILDDGLEFELVDSFMLQPGESRDLHLRLSISENASGRDFYLSLLSGDIEGIVYDGDVPAGDIVVYSSEPVIWEGPVTAVLEATFAGSISSYPNPFNPREESANIGYYLLENSDLQVRIFTLLGEQVWSRTITSTETLGRAGLHTGSSALQWYGRNDSGYEINSGVYICIVENLTTGEEERFKIAVVK